MNGDDTAKDNFRSLVLTLEDLIPHRKAGHQKNLKCTA